VIVQINLGLLSDAAFRKIEGDGIAVASVSHKAWLMGIDLPNNQTVAAYPISTLNPLAPPSIYITDIECNEGVDNRKAPSVIARKLKKWCGDDKLISAIKLLKKSIKSLES